MDKDMRCPFCGSPSVRLWEGVLRVRTVPAVGGGPGIERSYLVYRCLACGRGFDETEIEAGVGTEHGGLPAKQAK
jgi:DNA-directed RNA polymerase subunit RPC12/RpoP